MLGNVVSLVLGSRADLSSREVSYEEFVGLPLVARLVIYLGVATPITRRASRIPVLDRRYVGVHHNDVGNSSLRANGVAKPITYEGSRIPVLRRMFRTLKKVGVGSVLASVCVPV